MAKVHQDIQHLLAIENNNQFLAAAYLAILHRSMDESGRRYYMHALSKGDTYLDVLGYLCFSDEGKVQIDHLDWAQQIHNKKNAQNRLSKYIHRFVKKLNKKSMHVDIINNQTPLKEMSAKSNSLSRNKINILMDDLKYSSLSAEPSDRKHKGSQIWVDLTTSMEWQGGVVGIVRAELEVASGLARIDPNIRFSIQVGAGFVEIPRSELSWLLNTDNVTEAYMSFFGRYEASKAPFENVCMNLVVPEQEGLFHPYKNGDAIIAVGWKDSNKEKVFTQVKQDCPGIYLAYMVFDTILVNENTKIFYPPESHAQFMAYFKWITDNCDFIFCGGRNTQKDCEQLQKAKGWKVSHSIPVKFGTDIVKLDSAVDPADVLSKLGITGAFMMTVGTVEPRKNHATLYRAYLMMLDDLGDRAPQLVFVGRPDGYVADMIDLIKRHPKLKKKLILVSPTDSELAVLYKECLFTLLPSLYEGWSLALPESLGQGKFCLTADVPPLREIADKIVDFVEPFDVAGWAKKMRFYSTQPNALNEAHERVKRLWVNTSWQDTAAQIYKGLNDYTGSYPPIEPCSEVWFDLTTSYMLVPGVISGIVRVELCYAKYLNEIYPNVHYFAYSHGELFEIPKDRLSWLFDNDDIASAFKFFYEFWSEHERNGTAFRSPFAGTSSSENHPATLKKIGDNSIVFMVNIDWDLYWTKAMVALSKKSKNVVVAQFIHDVTPIVVPHLHQEITCEKFEPFFEYCSNSINYLQYGGNTAQIDGIQIQQQRGWITPESDYIKLASDFTSGSPNEWGDQHCLDSMGVHGDFIITVGTIEPRKNHEVLYKAYLTLLQQGKTELPMMIFVGKPGWNSSDFLSILSADKRVSNYIRIVTPTDYQLDVLYRKCKFAVLPSYYEGYSLTLNECLSYGKFCLTSDTPPLKEVGKDLVEYIDPLDTYAWAESIYLYYKNEAILKEKTQRIIDNWHLITWKDSARMLLSTARRAQAKLFNMNM